MERARPRGTVLDVGCGTGEDAVWLAAQGFSVVGIDGSPKMIAEAAAKGIRFGSSAAFECRALEDFVASGRRFDTIVSNFGALNCVPLGIWAEALPRLMNPSGRAFVSLMGPRPLPERLRGERNASARTPGAEVRVGDGLVRVHYEPMSAVLRALSTSAVVEHVEALGCLVPGPGYVGFARRRPIAMGILSAGEALLRSAPFFRDRGDHTLFEFRVR